MFVYNSSIVTRRSTVVGCFQRERQRETEIQTDRHRQTNRQIHTHTDETHLTTRASSVTTIYLESRFVAAVVNLAQ